MSRNYRERVYWFDPTAEQAIYGNGSSTQTEYFSVPRRPKTIEHLAQELVVRKFPDVCRLGYRELQGILAERRRRTKDIRRLNEEIRGASDTQCKEITHQLKTLQIDQRAANIVIERYKGR